MIGGQDIHLKTSAQVSALDCALRTIRLFWPHAVFESGSTAEVVTDYRHLAFAGIREVFAYRTAEASAQWEQLGADPTLHGTMIHLISSPRELSLTIDNHPNSQIEEIVKSIRYGLRINPFNPTRTPEAA